MKKTIIGSLSVTAGRFGVRNFVTKEGANSIAESERRHPIAISIQAGQLQVHTIIRHSGSILSQGSEGAGLCLPITLRSRPLS